MTRRTDTIPADFFEGLYRADADPWGFRTSAYEHDKYTATMAALARARYADALEVGCSIGVFTAQLAPRCDRLLAIDGSEVALSVARDACAAQNLGPVSFERRVVPDQFPAGRYDLVVLSEVLYYLTRQDLDRVTDQCLESAVPGAEIVLCHWLGETDYPLTGLEAATRFADTAVKRGCVHRVLHEQTYRLDHLTMR